MHLFIVTINVKKEKKAGMLYSFVLWMVMAVCWFFEWILHSCTHHSSQINVFHLFRMLHIIALLLIISLKSFIMNASYPYNDCLPFRHIPHSALLMTTNAAINSFRLLYFTISIIFIYQIVLHCSIETTKPLIYTNECVIRYFKWLLNSLIFDFVLWCDQLNL